ncbi:MAG: hypothetical protein ACRCZW_13805 [Lactobacillaceae bacterium]
MINTNTTTNTDLQIADILNAIDIFDNFTDVLDTNFFSYRKEGYDDFGIYSGEPDIEEVAGMYVSDQDAEILSAYSNLQEAVSDYISNGEYTKWRNSFTYVTYGEFLKRLIENDILPHNYLSTIEEDVNSGEFLTISDFIDRVQEDFESYAMKNNIATEGFLSETI